MKLPMRSSHHCSRTSRPGVLSANAIAILALIFSVTLGGAYAAGLANGSVKTRHLANGAVSETKLKDSAVAGAKIKKGAVSEAKLHPSVVSTLNQVRVGAPVRTGMTPTTDVNAAPEVRIMTVGAYTIYGKCWSGASGYGSAQIYVKSRQSGALLNTSATQLVGSAGNYPQANQAIPVTGVSTVSASNGANVFSGGLNAVYGSKFVRVDAMGWVRADAAGQSSPNYNTSRCVFEARATIN